MSARLVLPMGRRIRLLTAISSTLTPIHRFIKIPTPKCIATMIVTTGRWKEAGGVACHLSHASRPDLPKTIHFWLFSTIIIRRLTSTNLLATFPQVDCCTSTCDITAVLAAIQPSRIFFPGLNQRHRHVCCFLSYMAAHYLPGP